MNPTTATVVFLLVAFSSGVFANSLPGNCNRTFFIHGVSLCQRTAIESLARSKHVTCDSAYQNQISCVERHVQKCLQGSFYSFFSSTVVNFLKIIVFNCGTDSVSVSSLAFRTLSCKTGTEQKFEQARNCWNEFVTKYKVNKNDPTLCKSLADAKKCAANITNQYCPVINLEPDSCNPFCANGTDTNRPCPTDQASTTSTDKGITSSFSSRITKSTAASVVSNTFKLYPTSSTLLSDEIPPTSSMRIKSIHFVSASSTSLNAKSSSVVKPLINPTTSLPRLSSTVDVDQAKATENNLESSSLQTPSLHLLSPSNQASTTSTDKGITSSFSSRITKSTAASVVSNTFKLYPTSSTLNVDVNQGTAENSLENSSLQTPSLHLLSPSISPISLTCQKDFYYKKERECEKTFIEALTNKIRSSCSTEIPRLKSCIQRHYKEKCFKPFVDEALLQKLSNGVLSVTKATRLFCNAVNATDRPAILRDIIPCESGFYGETETCAKKFREKFLNESNDQNLCSVYADAKSCTHKMQVKYCRFSPSILQITNDTDNPFCSGATQLPVPSGHGYGLAMWILIAIAVLFILPP